MMKRFFLGAAAAALMAGAAGAANADALSYYYGFGATPTYTAFDPTVSGGATISFGGETFQVQMSGTGSNTLAGFFGSNALSVAAMGGTSSQSLTLVAFDSGLTGPGGKITAGYSNNALSSAGSVTEALYVVNSATASFVGATATPISSATLAAGTSQSIQSAFSPTSSTYGLAQTYTATYAPGTSVNATISSQVSAAPEPGQWALMLGGVAFFGLMLRRQNRRRETGASLTAA